MASFNTLNIAIGNSVRVFYNLEKQKRREKRKKLWQSAINCFEGRVLNPFLGFWILECLSATKEYGNDAITYHVDLLNRESRCLEALSCGLGCLIRMDEYY